MTVNELHIICTKEKHQAMNRAQNAENPRREHDSTSAVKAWEVLLEQLHKHNAVEKRDFANAKNDAFFMINFIADKEYRNEQHTKIKNLTLN